MTEEMVQMMIKLKFLRWGDYPGLSSWAQCNHKHSSKRKREAGELESEGSCDEGGTGQSAVGHSLRSVGSLWKPEARKWIPHWRLQKE